MGSLRRNQIQNLPDGFHSDGNNLYLRVKGNSRSWVYRYSSNHKVYEMGLGPAHLVSVEEARKKSVELGLARLNGSSPAEIRRESKSNKGLYCLSIRARTRKLPNPRYPDLLSYDSRCRKCNKSVCRQ